MVSHASLVAEIDVVNSMSTEDRLTHARQRRQEQIQRWREADLNGDNKEMANGDARKIKRIVKFGASVTLLEAAARDDLSEVKSLLEEKTDPNEANDDGLTALHQACIDNFEDMVKLLIEHGANVNAVDSEHWTPLHAACTCGHTNIAKILIRSGADLLALNADNNMPYDICEEDETLDYVEKAMAGKGITQEQINDTRSSKERQIISDMQSLVDQGKTLNFTDEVGATVLHIAAANGYADLTRFLILHSCDVNIKDNDGWTALHAAACWNQLDVVDLLGQQGADPTIKNSLGEQPSDVTDDDEIKLLLIKIRATMKDKKSKKLFPGFRAFSSRNNSRRASGIRGQSFKGRSKRDKKSGISTIEAKSEAQFWSGNQETADILKSKPTENNNHVSTTSPEEHSVKNKKDKNVPKNSSKKETSPHEVEVDGHSSARLQVKADTLTKKDKKRKKAKKAAEVNQESPVSTENVTEKTDLNGIRSSSSGSIRSVISTRSQYSLEEVDSGISPTNDGGTSFSGKTLAELKRERAQEKSNKASPVTADGDQSPGANYSDDIKQFKGLTANELSRKSHKRKFCIIL